MINKQQIFTSLSEFLTKQQNTPDQLKRGEYRSFFGNVRGSLEWVKRKELNEEELTIINQIATLLTDWETNYTNKLGITLEILKTLNNELNELLTKFAESKPKSQEIKPPKDNSLFDKVNERLEQAEKGFKWIDWYENNKTMLKGIGIIFIFLFAWLVIRAIKETFTK